MDFIAEEELCQQADEVWRHYACPACDGSAPPARPRQPIRLPSNCDGPCSVLPLVPFSTCDDFHGMAISSGLSRQ